MSKVATVKLTSAIGIRGVMFRAGSIVTVPEDAAKDLLRRGKAELAAEEDLPAEDAQADEAEAEAEAEKPAKAKK